MSRHVVWALDGVGVDRIVFLYEAIHSERDTNDTRGTEVGRRILDAPEEARRSILLAALKALARAPLEASSRQVNVMCDLRFVHDHHWGILIKALLRSRLTADDELVRSVLHENGSHRD